MVDIVTFRTTDGTRWGAGKGANLTPTEVDINFWAVLQRLVTLEDNPTQPIQIASFTVVNGTDLIITMMDGHEHGPLPLPVLRFTWRGDWQTATDYVELDVVKVDGLGVYLVMQDHTSAGSFDPNLEIGGDPVYHQLWALFTTNGAWKGEWTHETAYNELDVVKVEQGGSPNNDGIYLVLQAHESDTTFDPDALQGGDPIYLLMWVLSGVSTTRNFGTFIAGRPEDLELCFRFEFNEGMTIPDNALNSRASAEIAADDDAIFTLRKNGADIGSVTFPAGLDVGSFLFNDPVSFGVGDVLKIIAPHPQDATLADINFIFRATV